MTAKETKTKQATKKKVAKKKPVAKKPIVKKVSKKAVVKKKAPVKKKAAPKNKNGRPTLYTKSLSDSICARLAQGESMRSVCRDSDMPVLTTIFRWLREKPEFKQQYDIAKGECADYLVEEMLDIADNQVEQPLLVDGLPMAVDGKVVMVKDAVSVNHAKLRVDTRKWYASKLKPRSYGDKIEHSTEDGKPLAIIERVIVQA